MMDQDSQKRHHTREDVEPYELQQLPLLIADEIRARHKARVEGDHRQVFPRQSREAPVEGVCPQHIAQLAGGISLPARVPLGLWRGMC